MVRAPWFPWILALSWGCASTTLETREEVSRESSVQVEPAVVQVAGPPWKLERPFVDARLHLAQPRAGETQGAGDNNVAVLLVTYDSWHWSFKRRAEDRDGNELGLLDIQVNSNDPRQRLDDLKVVGVSLPARALELEEDGTLVVNLLGSPGNQLIELPAFYVRGCADRLLEASSAR